MYNPNPDAMSFEDELAADIEMGRLFHGKFRKKLKGFVKRVGKFATGALIPGGAALWGAAEGAAHAIKGHRHHHRGLVHPAMALPAYATGGMDGASAPSAPDAPTPHLHIAGALIRGAAAGNMAGALTAEQQAALKNPQVRQHVLLVLVRLSQKGVAGAGLALQMLRARQV